MHDGVDLPFQEGPVKSLACRYHQAPRRHEATQRFTCQSMGSGNQMATSHLCTSGFLQACVSNLIDMAVVVNVSNVRCQQCEDQKTTICTLANFT